MTLSVAILAGGFATRLYPITKKIPKSLIEVSGKPFICHQLDYLREQGVKKVIICVGYLGDDITAVIGNGIDFGIEVFYSFEGNKLLGTGGAIKKALPLLGENFFVLYGDSFLPIDFFAVENAFLNSKKQALMTVFNNKNHFDKSNVVFKNGELLEYNKKEHNPRMNFIDYGLTVLSSFVFDVYMLNDAVFDLAQLYHLLASKGQLAGYEVYERFYEIGSFNGLKDTENYLLTREKK